MGERSLRRSTPAPAPRGGRRASTALLLIDLQNDYFNDPELERCREDILDRCNRLVVAAREEGS